MTVGQWLKGVKVLFAHDTERALASAVALVNTDSSDGDGLPDVAALDAFVREWEWTGERSRDEEELEQVRALRPRLRHLWQLGPTALADEINALLREARALPQLVDHDGWGYHLHATEPTASVADRMAVEAAMAIADVVRAGALDRLRRCAASGCDDALVDLTKNAGRRFCDTTCANREHAAAYRARRAAG
jgi:predicted RNA-binding Zn ribbon-like protein